MASQPTGLQHHRPLAWLAAIFCVAIGLVVSANAAKTVVIDPGHGGRDNGAKWGGIAEKDLNLDVAKRVEALLKERGIPVTMTRRSDSYVSLDSRAAVANRYKNSLFVSIHFNAVTNRSIKGIETFYLSTRGSKLANSIQRRLAKRIQTRDRGTKKRHYAVLKKTHGVAVLVECGFISNGWERDRCSQSWYKNILAQEIANGIAAHWKYYK
ncbi:MAG: N-acetylmuramoyl-L-alanine amidase family protein [Verrucomicrobiales bacterium]